MQGYVGSGIGESTSAKDIIEYKVILIARRRWLMGGTRFNARGIDDDGNTANMVESE